MADKDNGIDWRQIVYRGVETQELDYKAAQNWLRLPRVGKAKFVRHAMAMANTNGGYIVVGVGEDTNGNPTVYTGLDEEQLRSFDPSVVGQFINLYADPSIDFDIVRPAVDGRRYAVFVIRRFSGLPHVSSDHCGDELQQGAFYIRTPDARSRPAYRASELHTLIQRALRNQRELLGRMLRGVLYEGRQFAEPVAEHEFQRQLQDSDAAFRQWLGPRHVNRLLLLKLVAFPPVFREEAYALSDIKKAIADVALPVPGDFPLKAVRRGEQYFTNASLLSRRRDPSLARLHFWQAFQSGLFHHVSSLPPAADGRAIAYGLLVNRIAAALRLLADFYSELGLADELLTVTVGLANVRDCRLVADGRGPAALRRQEYTCFIPDIVVRKQRTAADLCAGAAQHAHRIITEVCERFNFPADQHPSLRKRLDGILGRGDGPPDA